MMQTLRLTWQLLPRNLRWRWLGLGPLAALSAALEASAVGAVYVLIRLADDPGVAEFSRFAGIMPGWFTEADDARLLAGFALFVALLYVLKNSLRLFVVYLRQWLLYRVVNVLSGEFVHRYLSAPYSFHMQHNSAEMHEKVRESVDTLANMVVSSATVIVSEMMIVFAVLVVLIRSAPGDALLVTAGFAVLMVAMLYVTQRRHLRWGGELHELGIRNRRLLQESLNGIKEVKTLGLESDVLLRHKEQRRAQSRIALHRGVLEAVPHVLVETFFVLVLVALVWTLRADPSYGERMLPLIALFGYAALRLLPSLHWIVYHSNNLHFAAEPVADLYQDWQSLPRPVDEAAPASPPRVAPKSLRLRSLGFRYDESGPAALQDIDLEIRGGERVAIVGGTGAGKSTLLDIMLGLLAPTSGDYLVDGHAGFTRAQRVRMTALVPQHPFLLDDTVRNNIAPSGDGHDNARMLALLDATHLRDWLSKQALGLDTPIGENGVRMSVGERQRLALVRALYRDAPVLFLDEPTSALDGQTEAAIAETIANDCADRTVIMVTHRPALARRFDRVIWLDGGRLRDQGRFDELSARHPQFRERMSL